jgi:hypothetical protein
MSADEEYMEAQTRMEGAIEDFYEKALKAKIDEEYIIEDITEAVKNATNDEICLESE